MANLNSSIFHTLIYSAKLPRQPNLPYYSRTGNPGVFFIIATKKYFAFNPFVPDCTVSLLALRWAISR